jgi:hypothetical protein
LHTKEVNHQKALDSAWWIVRRIIHRLREKNRGNNRRSSCNKRQTPKTYAKQKDQISSSVIFHIFSTFFDLDKNSNRKKKRFDTVSEILRRERPKMKLEWGGRCGRDYHKPWRNNRIYICLGS